MTPHELAVQFFLQLAFVLTACKLVGRCARWIGQPQVVGEMITGVLLGPSLFGFLAPGWSAWLFPPDSMKVLFPASQLGLATYMFVVGLEFRLDLVKSRAHAAAAVSFAGMAAPFALGGILGWALHSHTDLFPAATSLFEASVFLGACMCITAFPMLARIIHHKNLTGTTMGTVALGAGAIDDAAAWCLLAVVLASFDGEPLQAMKNVGLGVAYVGFAFLILRPVLARWGRQVDQAGHLSESGFALALILLCAGAWFTDVIGLHAVFGAFVMGAIMPRGVVGRELIGRIQPLSVALLLPLFFTFSGLNTRITLLNSWFLWGIAAVILIAAILGKGVACWGAARCAGLSHRDSLGIGTLMNARGLMELIIINIGLQRGIISPELFAALVIMAIVTTLMASPLFEILVIRPRHRSV